MLGVFSDAISLTITGTATCYLLGMIIIMTLADSPLLDGRVHPIVT